MKQDTVRSQASGCVDAKPEALSGKAGAQPAAAPELDEVTVCPTASGAATGKMIRVLLADDHVLVRHGIMNLLEDEPDIEVCATADNGQQAVELARQQKPDIILMDMSMPKLSGVEATRILCSETPGICIIGLSLFDDVENTQAMMDAGATGYVIKGGPPENLLGAIRRGFLVSDGST